MEKDIVDGKIGELGAYDVEFKGGKLIAKASIEKLGLSAALELSADSDLVLDAIAKAIPGKIDDAVVSVIKVALKSM